MKPTTFSLAALLLMAVPVAASPADRPPTNLRLLARAALDEQAKSNHAKDAQEASAKLAALRAELEAQHGRKRKNWPAEAQQKYEAAEKADERASDLVWYAGATQQDMDDTLSDLTAALAKKKRLRLVADEAEADLVVEILGRGRGRHGGQLGNSSHVALRLKAGPRLSPAVVQRLKMEFTAGLKRRMAAFESEDPPAVALEIVGNGIGWRFATTMAADELDYMVKKNQGELAAASGK